MWDECFYYWFNTCNDTWIKDVLCGIYFIWYYNMEARLHCINVLIRFDFLTCYLPLSWHTNRLIPQMKISLYLTLWRKSTNYSGREITTQLPNGRYGRLVYHQCKVISCLIICSFKPVCVGWSEICMFLTWRNLLPTTNRQLSCNTLQLQRLWFLHKLLWAYVTYVRLCGSVAYQWPVRT